MPQLAIVMFLYLSTAFAAHPVFTGSYQTKAECWAAVAKETANHPAYERAECIDTDHP